MLNKNLFNKFLLYLINYVCITFIIISPAYGQSFFEGLFDNIITPTELGLIIIIIIALIFTPAKIRIKIFGVALGVIMIYALLTMFDILTRLS